MVARIHILNGVSPIENAKEQSKQEKYVFPLILSSPNEKEDKMAFPVAYCMVYKTQALRASFFADFTKKMW